MPEFIDVLNPSAVKLRQRHQPAFDRPLQQTAETEKASLLKLGPAYVDLVENIPDHVRDIMQQYNDSSTMT